ncbi:MAG TPA: mandelate racemase/muconate lactonizing enzyme family protein, partial [Casimicrobiaceae bacterium]|nr:mandelate racemase/muconate lactonizing enzyme family protein [Casimicrobiaceae bacterium]
TNVETFIVSLPRDVPYLGPLAADETVNVKGYFVRHGNRTVYPTSDMSVLVKATASDGTIGWGETYGIAAPQAVVALIDDLLAPFVIGRDPHEAATIWQDLYDMQRVRGASGGYYGDALAGIDIALYDLACRIDDVPLSEWLGGGRVGRIPAYVSGLPKATLDERLELARRFVNDGYSAIKYAAPAASEGIVTEMRALRAALGADVGLMVDLHWKFNARAALALVRELAPYHPRFIEAPCAPEDISALAEVTAASPVPIAVGEEWRNIYEAKLRFDNARIGIVQPEIAHTGVTQFMAIARAARAHHAAVVPHATVGVGIFLAASLHAAAAVGDVSMHEYQHSVLDRNLRFVDTTMRCEAGYYHVPAGPGHGVVPRAELMQFVRR